MNQAPMGTGPVATDATSDDRLWALLAYVLTPIVPVIILLMEDKKNRPFIRYHAVHAIAAWVAYIIVSTIVTAVTFGLGGICFGLLWLGFLYPAYLAYQGQKFEIPVITNFLKNQGWI